MEGLLMKISLYEQETIINYNQEEQDADVYTYDEKLIKKLKECCKNYPEKFKFCKSEGEAHYFKVHKKYISIKSPKNISEKQKANLKERAETMRKLKKY
jgi:uncharacterized protein YsxB (DUF464 family)